MFDIGNAVAWKRTQLDEEVHHFKVEALDSAIFMTSNGGDIGFGKRSLVFASIEPKCIQLYLCFAKWRSLFCLMRTSTDSWESIIT